jgi:cytochrome c oxidase subunit 3
VPDPRPRFGDGPGGGGGRSGGGGHTGSGNEAGVTVRTASLGIKLLLAPLLMFFLSIVSAFLVRRGIAPGWGSFALPAIVWANTAVLVASSFTAQRARRPGREAAFLTITFALGLVFLGGQIAAWRTLFADGIDLGATPYGSFFYLLTGAHAAHLLGGLVALGAALGWPREGRLAPRRGNVVSASVIYWHFLTVVWLGLVLLLAYWR